MPWTSPATKAGQSPSNPAARRPMSKRPVTWRSGWTRFLRPETPPRITFALCEAGPSPSAGLALHVFCPDQTNRATHDRSNDAGDEPDGDNDRFGLGHAVRGD